MLTTKEMFLINEYVQSRNGESFSLMALCDYLIGKGSSKKSYSTGKPVLYGYVAVYLEGLRKKFRTAEVKEDEQKRDITYLFEGQLEELHIQHPDEPLRPKGKHSEEKKEEAEKDEPEEGQLSLF
ncbi:DUF3895 domain-containing protein [Bacillus tianshenii]|nr:DUF3895 domain-containing protein [Bacillus tianshenii]